MPPVVTPTRLEHRAELYHQLGSLISSGIPILQSLEQIQRNPPHRSFRPLLAQLSRKLSEGRTFVQGMRDSMPDLPEFDAALLTAGEESGRLDTCFKLLALYYRESARLARNMIGALIYPAVLFHLAVFIFPTSVLGNLVLKGEVWSFIASKIWLLALYAILFLLVYIGQGRHGAGGRAWVESCSSRVPFLGAARREMALARLAAALEALIAAGAPVLQSWEIAAAASGSPAILTAVKRWRPHLEAGQTPGELLQTARLFPDLFANLYRSGEVSGRQEETLKHLHAYYQEEGGRKLENFVHWLPKAVYFLVALLVAWQIISFWKGHFQQLNDVMNFQP